MTRIFLADLGGFETTLVTFSTTLPFDLLFLFEPRLERLLSRTGRVVTVFVVTLPPDFFLTTVR